MKLLTCAILLSGSLAWPALAQPTASSLAAIRTIVVIYAENRSFDNLYGRFPGADGLANAPASATIQRDRDGTPLAELPPAWGGLTGHGVTPAITQAMSAHLPNRPFAIDDPAGFNAGIGVTTRDLWHRFYQNQMQINGGRNDMFVAWANSGGLVMGIYDGSKLPMWSIAQKYVLADAFFMGTFGGSFLNHFYLVCACVPTYPGAAESAAHPVTAQVDAAGVALRTAPDSPKSALQGPPKFIADGAISPDDFAVNAMQPPYQPSNNPPPPGGDPRFADPARPSSLPPQTKTHIGDLLSAAGIDWAWYAGAWQAALDGNTADPPNFQTQHAVFNYFADMAPGNPARAAHLRDGGMDGAGFLAAIDAGTLPPVAFYKPQGNLNEHPGYASVASGDQHLADIVHHLERSPQWPHMVVVVTYDENGGFWDHAAPPRADRWGPGTRIPAFVISPFARMGSIDHTPNDTGSILRLITRRFGLPVLDGLEARAAAMRAAGAPPLGDLTEALALPD